MIIQHANFIVGKVAKPPSIERCLCMPVAAGVMSCTLQDVAYPKVLHVLGSEIFFGSVIFLTIFVWAGQEVSVSFHIERADQQRRTVTCCYSLISDLLMTVHPEVLTCLLGFLKERQDEKGGPMDRN